jgi:hypothetical protein
MTLEVHRMLDAIEQAADAMVLERQEYGRLAGEALTRLHTYGDDLDMLQEKAQVAADKLGGLWRGAVPLGEPIASAIDPPVPPAPIGTVVAADGSQIFPDRHGIANYALIHIGAIAIRPTSNEPPETLTFAELLYGDRLHDDESAETLQAADISRLRDKEELGRLVQVSIQMFPPVVALMDSPLLLFALSATGERELPDWFLGALNRALESDIRLAGYVDRPGSRGVADLLALATIPREQIGADKSAMRFFQEMPDRTVFRRILGPGQRSALFSSASPFNRLLARCGDQLQIGFFYLNVGSADNPVMARVEAPWWVLQDRLRREQLHAAVWEQCQAPGGYPYVLARAHEIAVVHMEQRRQLEDILAGAMLVRGLEPQQSAKSFLKSLTGG